MQTQDPELNLAASCVNSFIETATPVCLNFIYDCFPITMAEMNR